MSWMRLLLPKFKTIIELIEHHDFKLSITNQHRNSKDLNRYKVSNLEYGSLYNKLSLF
jgi:hypothetical protein